jgi:hypothetical protein
MKRKAASNPKRTSSKSRGVVIYPRVIAIMAEKASGQRYKHPFTSRVPILGLPDGSLLIPAGKKPLWGTV